MLIILGKQLDIVYNSLTQPMADVLRIMLEGGTLAVTLQHDNVVGLSLGLLDSIDGFVKWSTCISSDNFTSVLGNT